MYYIRLKELDNLLERTGITRDSLARKTGINKSTLRNKMRNNQLLYMFTPEEAESVKKELIKIAEDIKITVEQKM
jgi:transcriptional regulator with XRE-family HTH domain